MPTTWSDSANAMPEAGRQLGHRAMYYVVRPLLKRIPLPCFVFLSMATAVPVGILQAFRQRDRYRKMLECCGRRDGLIASALLAIRTVYAKARHLEQYIYEVTAHFHFTWDGPPETEPCVYFMANMYGSEAIAVWMDRYPAIIVRRVFAGEGVLTPATASPGQMWRAHQARIRDHATGHRQVIVGDHPLAFRKLLDGRQSIIIYQDLWDTAAGETDRPFLGHHAKLMTGSLRLAKLAGGLPLRFMTIQPKGLRWQIHVGPRVEGTYETIATTIEADIRRRPAEWMLWNEWLEFVEEQEAGS